MPAILVEPFINPGLLTSGWNIVSSITVNKPRYNNGKCLVRSEQVNGETFMFSPIQEKTHISSFFDGYNASCSDS